MRDPSRIDDVLSAVYDAWRKTPDQRFGQLVENVSRDSNVGWSNEDDQWVAAFRAWEQTVFEPPDKDPTTGQASGVDFIEWSRRQWGRIADITARQVKYPRYELAHRSVDDSGMPGDAGEYADGLAKILARITEPYFRTIGTTGPGWYPILIACDEELAALCPNYEVDQIKQKLGGLKYYWTAPADCDPVVRVQMDAVVARYEAEAAQTCEWTGEPGILMNAGGCLRTLDPVTAPEDFVIYDADVRGIRVGTDHSLTIAQRLLEALRKQRGSERGCPQ